MTIALVNLTLLRVTEELENFLATYPDSLYQRMLVDDDCRQKLLAYVLNRVPNRFITIEEESQCFATSQSLRCSTQEMFQIEDMIHQGIYYLLEEEHNFIRQRLELKYQQQV